MGPGILPETTVGKHNPPCHLQMPTIALSYKKEAICEHGPEAPSCPMGQGSTWKSVLWSDESKFDILVGNPRLRVLRAREEGDLPVCYQRSVQKPASLIVWGCISAYGMGSLHVLEGTMNAERYIKSNILEQHMLPSRQRLFQQDNAKPHTAAITTAWLRSRRVRVLNWPTCSPDLSPIENIWHIIKRKIRQRWPRTLQQLTDENGWDTFVRVSLCLESRSRKTLEKQYLFRGSYKLSFFSFFFGECRPEQETGRHSRYMIWLIFM